MKKKILLLFILVIGITFITGCGSKGGKNSSSKKETYNKDAKKIVLDVNQEAMYKVVRFYDGYAIVKSNGNYGVIDKYGNIIVEFNNKSINQFSADYFNVNPKNGSCYLVYVKDGKPIKKENICLYTGFEEGYAVAYDSKTLKMGVVDKDLNTIIPFKYKRLTPISENRTFGYDGKILYLLDLTGKSYGKFYPNKRLSVSEYKFSNGVFPVTNKNGKYYLINTNGKAVSGTYDYITPMDNDRAGVVVNRKVGFINSKGKLVIPVIYDIKTVYDGSLSYRPFLHGYAVVGKNKLYGVIDKNGKTVIPFKYSYIIDYKNNLFKASLKSKIVYFDLKGHTYKYAYTTSDGISLIQDNSGKYYYMDSKGNILFNKKFDNLSAHSTTSDYNMATLNGVKGYITKDGEFKKLPEGFEQANYVYAFNGDMITVKNFKTGEIGYYNAKTEQLVGVDKYTNSYVMFENRAFVVKNNKLAVVDETGKVVIGNLD